MYFHYHIKISPDRTIDCALLFQRFIVVSKTGELSLEDIMLYELCPYPPALFETSNLFRKADKPQLAQVISEYANVGILDNMPETECYVLDGGSLLHRVPWKRGETYATIAKSYADFTIKHYAKPMVIFDGYECGPSIKDNVHQRRGYDIHPIVSFTCDTEFNGKKEEFLSRTVNKQQLINLITVEMKKRGTSVLNALGDADVEIVKAAVENSRHHTTTLIGEDTDLLILLLHYANLNDKDLYFRSDKFKSEKCAKVFHINKIKEILGNDICTQLLFIHAMTGCDRTSRIFGISKKAVFLKLIKGDPILQSIAKTFASPNQSVDVIEGQGCHAMSVLFGGKITDCLAKLRYKAFTKKVVSTSSFVTPERLPPTEDATKLHCRRVYYQVMVWMGTDDGLDATDWGWNQQGNHYIPIMSKMNAAPDRLLKVIHCKCSNACMTQRCSCRKYG